MDLKSYRYALNAIGALFESGDLELANVAEESLVPLVEAWEAENFNLGNLTHEQLRDFRAEQIASLYEAGCDPDALDIAQVSKETGLSVAEIYEKTANDPEFPKPYTTSTGH